MGAVGVTYAAYSVLGVPYGSKGYLVPLFLECTTQYNEYTQQSVAYHRLFVPYALNDLAVPFIFYSTQLETLPILFHIINASLERYAVAHSRVYAGVKVYN